MSTGPVQLHFSPDEINHLLSLIDHSSTTTAATATLSSSDDTNKSIYYSTEERKCRRMISNRESARRSRERKKQHLEKLVVDLNRLKFKNRELKDMLCVSMCESHVALLETELLRSECVNLRSRLSGLYQILMSMQL